MTKYEVLPSGETKESDADVVTLAAIAGVLMAVLLCSTAALLALSHTGLAAWAGFALGALFGLSSAIAAALLARTKG
jgi:hypothetical protein